MANTVNTEPNNRRLVENLWANICFLKYIIKCVQECEPQVILQSRSQGLSSYPFPHPLLPGAIAPGGGKLSVCPHWKISRASYTLYWPYCNKLALSGLWTLVNMLENEKVLPSLSALIYNKIKGLHNCLGCRKTGYKLWRMLINIVFNTFTMYRASAFNASRFIVNDWRSLYVWEK